MHGIINLDFRDVCTVLKDGGVAIMSTGFGEGENRVTKAIENALNSPLLNNTDIFHSKKVLLSISFCAEKEGDTLMMEEMNEVHEFMSKFHDDVETKWGLSTNDTLGKQVKITILATGFGMRDAVSTKLKRLRNTKTVATSTTVRTKRSLGNVANHASTSSISKTSTTKKSSQW